MKAVIDPTELKKFLDYLSDKADDADQHEVDRAIDRFLKEKVSVISGDIPE